MNGSDDREDQEEGGLKLPSLADVARLVRRRAWLAIVGVVVGGLAAFLFLTLLVPQYRATATVLIDPREKRVVDIENVTSELVANTPTMQSEVEIVRSREVVARVISKLELHKDRELTEDDRPLSVLKRRVRRLVDMVIGASKDPHRLEDHAAAGPMAPEAVPDWMVHEVSSRITAGRMGESYLIFISYDSRDADNAARMANAIAENYVRQQVEAKTEAARHATDWLDQRITTLKERVSQAERAVDEYKAANSLIDTEGQPLDERQVARQMEQLVLARAATAEAQAKYERMSELAETPEGVDTVGDVLNAHTIGLLKNQLAEASRRAAELDSKYGAMHPSMIKAAAEVRDLKAQLTAEVQRFVANQRNEYEVAKQREADAEATLDGLKATVNSSGAAMVRLRELEREAKASRDIYETFLKRAQETAQQQDLQMPDARVIDRAAPPGLPFSPKRPLILAAGLIGGFGLGLVLAFLLELLSPSFVRSEQIESSLSIRHLATVPIVDGGGGDPLDEALRTIRHILIEPRSQFAECIRAVRVAVERGRRDDGPQVVLVASALPGEGKSVIASNLALHYSLSGVKTVLVDCDLRLAGLTQQLLPGATSGVLEAIMRRLPLRDALVREHRTGLHFLPAMGAEGAAVSAAELIASPPMAAVLETLKREFDMVVLDCPPVMPVVDASLLADLADQVVFVMKWKSTGRALTRRAIGKLSANVHKLTGVVVNQVDGDQLGTLQAFETGEYGTRHKRSAA